jgi:hypothetical protein
MNFRQHLFGSEQVMFKKATFALLLVLLTVEEREEADRQTQ